MKIFGLYRVILILFLYIQSAAAQYHLQLTQLNNSCDSLLIQTLMFFSFGAGPTCPDLSGYSIDYGNDTTTLKLYYDISGFWPQVGCIEADTINLSVNSSPIVLAGLAFNIIGPDTTSEASDVLITNCITGINSQLSHDPIYIRPNPLNDFLYVHNIINPKGIILIYDLSGRIVIKEKIHSAVNVQHLAAGIYNVKIIGEDFAVTRKLIKNK